MFPPTRHPVYSSPCYRYSLITLVIRATPPKKNERPCIRTVNKNIYIYIAKEKSNGIKFLSNPSTQTGDHFAPGSPAVRRSRSHRNALEATLFPIKDSLQPRVMERHWGGRPCARASAVWHRWMSEASATHERTARLSSGSTLTRTSMLGAASELDAVRTSYLTPASARGFPTKIRKCLYGWCFCLSIDIPICVLVRVYTCACEGIRPYAWKGFWFTTNTLTQMSYVYIHMYTHTHQSTETHKNKQNKIK